jgi:hypothetical protein
MPSGGEVPSPAGSGYLLGMPSGSEVHSPAGSGYLLGMPSGSEVPSRAITNPAVNYWGYQHQNSFYNYPTSTHSVATGYEVCHTYISLFGRYYITKRTYNLQQYTVRAPL